MGAVSQIHDGNNHWNYIRFSELCWILFHDHKNNWVYDLKYKEANISYFLILFSRILLHVTLVKYWNNINLVMFIDTLLNKKSIFL
jgi:hypothetical protein